MNAKWIGAAALCALLVSTSGCTRKFEPPRRDGGTTGTNNGEADLGNEGDPCASSDECSAGLVCGEESKVCEALHDVAEGNPCTRTAECADGLYCEQATSLCAPAGDAALGDLCGATAECAAGLVCAARGFSGECVEAGENDLGEACEGSRDCVAGLGCAAPLTDPTAPPVCQAGVAGLGLPWPGEECAADETGNFRPYFEVPGDDAADFYRLPYPNDIRLEGGHPNLDGHPTPGAERLGFDVAQSTIDAVEQSQDRFGLNSWVLTRFSERVDFDTLGSAGDTASIFATVLTPDRADYGRPLSIRWKANTSRNRYICQNWLAVRPGGAWGRPLAPDTTYAVVITTGVKSVGGVAAGQDEDFAAMLAEARPSGALGDAWDAYQPLRDWIAESGTDPATIASAAVFTTGDPAAEARALAAPARDAIPAASALTLCDEGTTSPCDDGLEGDEHVRGCFGADPEFREIHGKLGLPIFQEGEAPYLTEGGGVTPTVKRTEDVCVAMTVPADAMPEAGWPVLVYAHGTGGSFRSHISDGTLDIVNSIEVDGAEVQFLTIGWDQVQHFTRRNGDDTHPDGLVFNYANPVAAKGNFLQAAADIHAVMA